MKKVMSTVALAACLLAGAPTSQAAVTLAQWAGTPQVAGDVTYTLVSATLPANWEFSFSTFGGFTAQSSNMGNPSIPVTGMGPWSLVYYATVAGAQFSAVSVDSTIAGNGDTYVGKVVTTRDGQTVLAGAESVGGANSGFVGFLQPASTILVTETIWAGENNAVTGFDNTYVVPEPSTVVAGCLLVLPFAASTIRFMRKNRKA